MLLTNITRVKNAFVSIPLKRGQWHRAFLQPPGKVVSNYNSEGNTISFGESVAMTDN